MAYELMFSEEFFYGDGIDDVTKKSKRPTSVVQALHSMTKKKWSAMLREVNLTPNAGIDDVMDVIVTTNTCGTLKSPVDVWIDPEGYFTIDVYDREE